MSLSNVLRRFSLAEEIEPVGSEDFVRQALETREATSPEGQRLLAVQQQAEREKQDAYAQGLAAGEKRGLQRGLAQMSQVKANLQSTIEAVTAYRVTLYKEAEQQLLNLAFALADKILSARAKREQEVVLDSINKCVAAILDKSGIRIKVNPAQSGFVGENVDAIRQANDELSNVSVEADSRVPVGGCIIETDSGSADGRIASQLAQLQRELESIDS
jgi:flagellar assembly protein FliH